MNDNFSFWGQSSSKNRCHLPDYKNVLLLSAPNGVPDNVWSFNKVISICTKRFYVFTFLAKFQKPKDLWS